MKILLVFKKGGNVPMPQVGHDNKDFNWYFDVIEYLLTVTSFR